MLLRLFAIYYLLFTIYYLLFTIFQIAVVEDDTIVINPAKNEGKAEVIRGVLPSTRQSS